MYVPVVPSFDCHTIVLCTEQESIQIFSLYLIIVISKYINYNTAVTRFRKTYLGFLQDCYKIPQDLTRSRKILQECKKKGFFLEFQPRAFLLASFNLLAYFNASLVSTYICTYM